MKADKYRAERELGDLGLPMRTQRLQLSDQSNHATSTAHGTPGVHCGYTILYQLAHPKETQSLRSIVTASIRHESAFMKGASAAIASPSRLR
jgi:hypothetical protein